MPKHSTKRLHSFIPESLPYRCACAAGITFCTGGILLLISACIAYAQADPAVLSRPLALVSLFLSVLFGGYISARGATRPVLSAAVCGVGTVLVLMILSLIPWSDGASRQSALYVFGMYIGVIAAAIIGALLAMRKPKKRTARHRKMKHK